RHTRFSRDWSSDVCSSDLFFTFRPRKGQRSWLDAHNATAVLALPFHFMITYSGLLLFMYMLMPWGVSSAYQGDMQAYFSEAGNRDRKGVVQGKGVHAAWQR